MSQATTSLEAKALDSPEEVRNFADEMGGVEIVNVGGVTVGKGTFRPGWRWTQHVKPIAGTDSCQVRHIGYVLEGAMTIRMDDGSESTAKAGDAINIPPGHDAWVEGGDDCVVLDFGGLEGYAQQAG